ncbi:hypothetical protein ACFLZY_01380, partial [Patescibacteria group bacterium]
PLHHSTTPPLHHSTTPPLYNYYMITYLLAGAIGGLVAFVFAIPAIILEIIERGDVKNLPLLVDIKTVLGRRFHKEEVFLMATFFHIVLGIVYGIFYVLFANQGWLLITNEPYSLFSMILFAVLIWFVVGAVVYPLLQMGWFGSREGRLVWLELLVSLLLIGLGWWVVVHFYYQPFFF